MDDAGSAGGAACWSSWLVFYAVPVLAMLMRSVADPTWTLANYQALPHDTVFLNVFWTTLRTAAVVTCGCLLLGYPVALALVRPGRTAGVALIIVLLPFWTSILVRSYAWMVLLGRRGLLNEALLAGGLIDHPLRILNTSIAVHIAMIHILLPYMILPIANALRQIDPSLARAALGLGATPFRAFREVILPLSMPGVAAGVLLVFVLSLGFYITPALVGGPQGHDDVHADRPAGGPVELALCRVPVGNAAGRDTGDHGAVPSACSVSAARSGWLTDDRRAASDARGRGADPAGDDRARSSSSCCCRFPPPAI